MMWLLYAALAAVCFGLRGILYHWTSQKPIDRNVLLLGVYLCGALISALFALLLSQHWSAAIWTGLSMGIFSFISNAAMFKGFAVGKASLVAIFTALTPIVVVGISFGLWGETLNLPQTAAFIIILAGIVMIRYSNDISLKNLKGAQWALLAMVTFGITDISSKQAMLWGADKLPTLFIMYATGSVLFFLSWYRTLLKTRKMIHNYAVTGEIAAAAEIKQPAGAESRLDTNEERPVRWTIGRTLMVGMAVGLSNISGMMLILPAFELGVTGLVSAIVATSVLLILLYARFVLKEVWSLLEFLGILTAIAGVLILRLLG
jgi:drug/metabolite transporter (DMT)-like permease